MKQFPNWPELLRVFAHCDGVPYGSRRIAVAFEWICAYLTFRRNTRLIAGKVD